MEAQHQALIESYLADKQIGKARKAREAELDLNAQIAGMLAGQRVEMHAALSRSGDEQSVLTGAP